MTRSGDPMPGSAQSLCWLVAVTLACGTLFYWNSEGGGLLDSPYFSVITATAAGKVFTMLHIFAGFGIILGFVSTAAERLLRRRRENCDQPLSPAGRDKELRAGAYRTRRLR